MPAIADYVDWGRGDLSFQDADRADAPSAIISGSGAHSDPGVALSRAITEAVQSRLTHISGARDDITSLIYAPGHYRPPAPASQPAPWPQIIGRYNCEHPTDTGEASWLATRISEVTGWEPRVVDLTHGPHQRQEFAVVKVAAPGLIYSARHVIPRHGDTGTETTGGRAT
ncbi:YcaO-like family protein [Actinomadura alba]|uniref:YcaO-like family protein n=1 Tax=Actinomadura alba TaxID=406431 RepID=A0ABR7M3T2_9ACTN|nr:YcaO-like family protein [Actinomadura alba]MBC6471385.1 YcaO-like family protein [Actinomadura alba]